MTIAQVDRQCRSASGEQRNNVDKNTTMNVKTHEDQFFATSQDAMTNFSQ